MDTKHEALLQHYLHRRLQEMQLFSAALPQPNFMSPHLYSSVFATEEIATDLTCRRRDNSSTRTPATTATTPAISQSNASDILKASSNHETWQPATCTSEGVPAPPGAHTMISAPPVASPFRSPGSGGGGVRTSPWPTTPHAPEGFGRFAVGGSVYSLFPSLPSATEASAIYSQASNSPGGRFGGQSTATTFHSFLSAQKGETLFSAGFPLTPNSLPSNSPQQQQLFSAGTAALSQLEAERGVTQLELMARGFTGVRRPEDAREERKPRARQTAKEKRQSKKIRDTLAETERKNSSVKTERASCGCASVRASGPPALGPAPLTIATGSPASPCLLRSDVINIPMFPSPPSLPPQVAPTSPSCRGETETRQSGGCSRTIPLPPRSKSSDSTNNPAVTTIKKELGTPCQVAEVTTSRSLAPEDTVCGQGTKVAHLPANNNVPVDVTGILPVHNIKTEPVSEPVVAESPVLKSSPVSANLNSAQQAVCLSRQPAVEQPPSVDIASKPRAVLAPAPPDKPRDDFRVLLPSRGRPVVTSSTCVLSSPAVSVQTAVQACSMHQAEQQRTTTLTIPASSIMLHTASSSAGSTMPNNTTTLQVQSTTSCDEAVALAARLTNQIPPWTQHNSALTPPTLWLGQPQYQTGASVPVQLEAAPPALPPLPPVGLQLVRDPISGHLLLLPAASLEHLQRAAAVQVWPSNTSGFQTGATPQLMLHQAAPQAPQTQHITLFQQAPSNPPQSSAPAPQPETEFRILIPPQHSGQLALIHEAVKSKKPGEEAKLDTMTKLLPDTPTSFVFPQAAPAQQPQQLQYFYEQLTGAVQLAPQTSLAAVAPPVDTGRRSQGTSPANPAEGCLTPPPESSSPAAAACAERVSVSAAPQPEEAAQENTADSSCSAEVAAEEPASVAEVSVQDASNQTETPPVSEDESTRDESPEEEVVPAPPPPPVDVSGLELLSNSIEQFTQREKQAEEKPQVDEVPPPPAAEMVGGLGLLCALAEQRFMEDIEIAEKQKEAPATPVKTKEQRIDINRNYKSPKSEREIKKFIASKVSQYTEQASHSCHSDSTSTDLMDAMELDMRMRLAELQRKYKEKQKELSKLQHSARRSTTSDDGSNSPGKRGPGRPRKRKLSSVSSPQSPRSRKARSKERSPPLLDKSSEVSVSSPEEQDMPKLKPTKEILKPPTLTANKILTSAKFKPTSPTCLASKFKLPSCNVNLVKLKSPPAKVKSSKSSEESVAEAQHWLTGGYFRRNPCAVTSRKPLGSTSTRPPPPLSGYTFGSKQLTPSLLSGGEKQRLESLSSDSPFWFIKPQDTPPVPEPPPHQFGSLPTPGGEKRKLPSSSEAESDPETPRLFSAAVVSEPSSSSKKRKPGRPKRRAPSRQDEEATETIVAKKPKSISFLLSPPSPPSLHKPKIKPKLKAEAKLKSPLSCDDEDETWPRRPAEARPEAWNLEPEKPKHGIDAATRLGGAKKRVSSPSVVPAKVRCPSGGSSSEARPAKPEEETKVEEPPRDVITEQQEQLPPEGAPSCALTQEDLEGEPRALAVMGGLVYAGHVTAIRAPDVYGITLDGERGNRPHIFCREEMLKEAIREVKPRSTGQVPPGTRVCAYWSQQYRCLYPGTVATPTSPDPQTEQSFVNVEFDDGDSGRIHLDDIRMLPPDFPIVEYDPNPLMSLAKRRRRASGASSTEGRRTSSETPLNTPEVPTQPLSSPEDPSKEAPTEVKPAESLVAKSLDDEERERRRQKKREKAKKKEKLRKLLARGVAALGKLPNRKKHKKRRCEERHHHKHHHRHRKHRHHRHDKARCTDTSSSTNSSSPAPEPPTPELPQPEPEIVEEPPPVSKKAKVAEVKARKRQERQSSAESRSKMAAFLPARQLWRWAGRGYKRPGAKGRGKKEFFKSIQRGKETINVGDCAVFLSTGRPDRPYIGRIETMWESWGGNMVVRVKWFYHPEETQGGEGIDKLKYPGALFQSPHADENDVQTISHRCEVLALGEYTRRLGKEPSRYTTIYDNNDIYYLAGSYDPTAGVLTMEQGVTSP